MTEVTSLAYEAYNDAVEQRMEELRSYNKRFGSAVDFRGLVFEDHEEGECVQCDAYRRLSSESDDD